MLKKKISELKKESERIGKLEEEKINAQFLIWKSKLTQDEIKEISPMFTKKGEALDAVLMSHFEEEIYKP